MLIGIVGCGRIGRRHAAIYAAAGHRVHAVADPFDSARRPFVEEYRARQYADPVEMIEGEQLDVVSICSPPAIRLAPALAAARRGCHIFCEKPMALTLKEAETMWSAARAAGVALGMGFKMRFEGAFATIRRLLDAGAIGQPEEFILTYFQPRPAIGWYLEVGALQNMIVHPIDLATWYFGRPALTVRAELHRTFSVDAEDRVELTLDFGGSRAIIAGGYIELLPAINGRDDICFQLLGSRGYIAGNRSRGLLVINERGVESVQATPGDGFDIEIRAFLDAIALGPQKLPVSGLDGLLAQAVIEASYDSARSKRAVEVPRIHVVTT
jgi:myo-inositol 2-dehydrogenase/D-chiro-inositol 1-dehydrogenase